MNYRVVITDTAKQDLREIAIPLANQAKDTDAAKKFVSELTDKCKKLEALPNGGALPKDRVLLSTGYRYISHKNYLIFYLVDETEKTLRIMAIFNEKKGHIRVMPKYI
ncbi:MAG: type II toxin-antitoxin system RelE/ParE family toxin [Solobacterium sp.]|nr:type II toxin-antitoxin system RelE/ParE family toxin [Solobacterium sp.]